MLFHLCPVWLWSSLETSKRRGLDSKDLSEEDRRRLSTVALFVNEAGTDCFGPDPDGLREALCEAPGNFPQEERDVEYYKTIYI